MSALRCRSCDGATLFPVLSLGRTPLANSLVVEGDLAKPERLYPLDLVFCPKCTLLQITETVPPEQLFSHYVYYSSFSDTMLAHARSLAKRLISERSLGPQSMVIEAASNDGYLLQAYASSGVPVLGIEPAANIAKLAEERGITTRCAFFGQALAQELGSTTRADVFHAHNVLAHVPDLNGFVAGIRTILKPSGIAVIEAPQAKEMIERLEFDTIYHEHLCYFSLSAIQQLFARNGLSVVDAEEVSIHGGSLRVFAQRSDAPGLSVSPRVGTLLAAERSAGLVDPAYYGQFAKRVDSLRQTLFGLVRDLRAANRTVAAYGAAAKGSTLLNFCGLGRDMIAFVADRSTHKQGYYMPGVHIPIVAPEHLGVARPDYVLLLAWNFASEIMVQQAPLHHAGTRFILPIPQVTVV